MKITPRSVALTLIAILLIFNEFDIRKKPPEQPVHQAWVDSEIIGLSSLPSGKYTLTRVVPVKYLEPAKTIGQYVYEVKNEKGADLKVTVITPRNRVEKANSIIEVNYFGGIRIIPPPL